MPQVGKLLSPSLAHFGLKSTRIGYYLESGPKKFYWLSSFRVTDWKIGSDLARERKDKKGIEKQQPRKVRGQETREALRVWHCPWFSLLLLLFNL